MVEDATRVAELLERAGAALGRAGVPEPRREALQVWAGLQGTTPAASWQSDHVTADPALALRFESAVQRRTSGEPLAYVVGWTGFRHLTLGCDRRALIPRPETEGLVEAALARVASGVAIDVGTGTGAIALSLRQEGTFSRVVGVDASRAALQLASANGIATGVATTWVAGDLVRSIAPACVNLLVSNPPYLTDAEHDALDPSVRDYEPRMALASGVDGLDATRQLLDEGRRVMVAGGWIALEVDHRRAEEIARFATALGWMEAVVQDDLFGRARYVLARQGAHRDR